MGSYLITLLAFGCLFVAAQSANIAHFSIDRTPKEKSFGTLDELNAVNNLKKTWHGFFESHETKKAKRLGDFDWKNCGSVSQELFVIESLTISPDPIQIPGNLVISMKATFNKTVDAPLKVVLKVMKQVFGFWVELPCDQDVGSCTYDDICETLSSATCPLPFVQQKVPCKCPFPKGSYTLTNAAFKIPASPAPGPLESGDFAITAHLSMNGALVGCYVINLTLGD